MDNIGLYQQVTEFTTAGAGTSEWCYAVRDGKKYFIKKFHNPVYPSPEAGLPEKKYQAKVRRFHKTLHAREEMYERLREADTTGVLVLPEEVFNYRYHICTAAPYTRGSIDPEEVCQLSEWQRLVLMRTLVHAVMNVHAAGVVHSDMKPDNVIITQLDRRSNYIIRLIDFDESFYRDDPPDTPEKVHGDPTYFAPEEYEMSMGTERRLDEKIDVFALGIILHYFWCGRIPEKPADQTLGEYLLSGKALQLHRFLPEQLARTIRLMLVVKPESRISCAEVYEEIGKLIPLYPVEIRHIRTKAEPEVRSFAKTSGRPPEGSGSTASASETGSSEPVRHADEDAAMHWDRYDPAADSEEEETAAGIPDGKKRRWPWIMILIAVAALAFLGYCFRMKQLALSAYGRGNYKQSLTYINRNPMQGLMIGGLKGIVEYNIRYEEIYLKAIDKYRSGDYPGARIDFESLPESFQSADQYITLCKAHMYHPVQFLPELKKMNGLEDSDNIISVSYDTIVVGLRAKYEAGDYRTILDWIELLPAERKDENVELFRVLSAIHLQEASAVDHYDYLLEHIQQKDAAELLVQDDDALQRYLRGIWKCYYGLNDYYGEVEVTEDGFKNIPESPGGGYGWIHEGYYQYSPDDDKYTKILRIAIVDNNSAAFTSVNNGTVYRLHRQ